jgi:hypothetical protein
MIVMFSARRLKPGAWEQFRNAWDRGDEPPRGSSGRITPATFVRRGHLVRAV